MERAYDGEDDFSLEPPRHAERGQRAVRSIGTEESLAGFFGAKESVARSRWIEDQLDHPVQFFFGKL